MWKLEGLDPRNMGVCKTPRLFVQSSMIPDEPFLVFALEKNNNNEEEENDNVGCIYVNDMCPYS